jgi:hypothetical protein
LVGASLEAIDGAFKKRNYVIKVVNEKEDGSGEVGCHFCADACSYTVTYSWII